ncbi:MAG UNVERIFIED_CONTAM: PstS family phosphate ABC transporter substrate-binding protein [Planctomycetaceae bacterium]
MLRTGDDGIDGVVRVSGLCRSAKVTLGLVAACLGLVVGCSLESVDAPAAGNAQKTDASSAGTGTGAGSETEVPRRIQVNGSSTVYRVAIPINEDFEDRFRDTKVQVTSTGTGTGFKEMIAGRIDIANASRPIKATELEECSKAGIELVELKICLDGLTVCVNTDNTWVDSITVAQLKKIWEPGSKVETWKDVDPAWPAEPLRLFGPGDESGTFDYFTEVINGKEDAIREGYGASSDDNVTVSGIAGEKGGMGFFGCAYYFSNSDKVRALKISATDNPADGVGPTVESVRSGTYTPLARPLFIYVRRSALARQEVQEYARYILGDGQAQVSKVGYVPLDEAQLKASQDALEKAISELSAAK